MTGWGWLWTFVGIGLVIWQTMELLGPFQLDPSERPQDAARHQLVRAWASGWIRRPREPLTFSDWFVHGRLFLPSFAAAMLMVGGSAVLSGTTETFRLGGALALAAGLLMTLTIGGYVLRPVEPMPTAPVGNRFPAARPGYDSTEVEEVYARLSTMTSDEINAIRFRRARVGYDITAVDNALDRESRVRRP